MKYSHMSHSLQQRRERVVEDEVELQRLDDVEFALQNVLVLERVHGLVFVHTGCKPRGSLAWAKHSCTICANVLVV